MDKPITYDEVMEQATASGLLHAEEVKEIEALLVEMRHLTNQPVISSAENAKINKLHVRFNDLLAKGLPHLAPKKTSFKRYIVIAVAMVVCGISCFVFLLKNT